MKDISWAKVIMVIIGFMVTNLLGDWLSSKYAKGELDAKIDYIEHQLTLKPNNDVLLQWMKLSQEADKASKDRHLEIRKRIERIEALYINERFRNHHRRKCTYNHLVNFLWEQGEWDFSAEYLDIIYD